MVVNTKLASILRFLLPRQRYLQKFTAFYKSPRYCFTMNQKGDFNKLCNFFQRQWITSLFREHIIDICIIIHISSSLKEEF